MTKELSDKLRVSFPNLYRDLLFGFGCGDGWYHIIYDLSEKLEHEILKFQERYPGIDPRLLPSAHLVRELFGSLQMTLTVHCYQMDALIQKAVEKSERTCEVCGEYGSRMHGEFWDVRCEKHGTFEPI